MNIVECPHCNGSIIVTKLNCGIFRHGVFKKTNKPIDPHLSQVGCEKLITDNVIYGCGKPFQIVISEKGENNSHTHIVSKCDYI